MHLVDSCVDRLLTSFPEGSTSKLWRAKPHDMPPQGQTPLLLHFTLTTPESGRKRARLKTVLFLYGSTLYDPERIKGRWMEYQKVLKLDITVMDGQVGSLLPFMP